MTTRLAVTVWTLALLIAAGAFFVVSTSDHESHPLATAILTTVLALTFVASGLVAASRRPHNRVGLAMVAVGFAWFLASARAADAAVLFTAGVALSALMFAAYAYLILAFPSGRLATRLERAIVAAAFAIALVGQPATLLFARSPTPAACDAGCPDNLLLIGEHETLATAVDATVRGTATLLVILAFVVLIGRWRAATPASRRSLAPVLLTSAASLILIAAFLVGGSVSREAGDAVYLAALASLTAVPIAFLAGVLRSRLARASVPQLLLDVPDEPTPHEARDGLRRALHDPTLELYFWLPEAARYVDADGRPVSLPADGGGRATTWVDYEDRHVAALVHDPAVRDEPELVEAVVAAARLALDRDRNLQALRESEARNRALLDAIPDTMLRVRRDGTYLDVSRKPGHEAVLPPEDVVGRNVSEVLTPDRAANSRLLVEQALATREVQTVQFSVRGDGRRRYFEARVAPSGPDEAVFILRDITDATERGEALRASEARNRALLDAIPDLMFRIARDGTYLDYKADHRNQLASAPGEIVGRTVRERLPADAADCIMTGVERAFADGTTQTIEYQLSFTGEPRDYEGRIVRSGADEVVLIVRDVSERTQQEQEIRASRARLVEAQDAERRRLERNLHDGAQQRLVAHSLSLRLAKARLESDPRAAAELIDTSLEELSRALDELRELARGIHPAILSDRGLHAAVEALAARSPVPVEVSMPDERLPDAVEAAAYYVVSEALANVSKYARASAVTVCIERRNGKAVVDVTDDGVGGADPSRGTGLRGLTDRVEALDGRLAVESRPGAGTRLRAEIPLPADAAG